MGWHPGWSEWSLCKESSHLPPGRSAQRHAWCCCTCPKRNPNWVKLFLIGKREPWHSTGCLHFFRCDCHPGSHHVQWVGKHRSSGASQRTSQEAWERRQRSETNNTTIWNESLISSEDWESLGWHMVPLQPDLHFFCICSPLEIINNNDCVIFLRHCFARGDAFSKCCISCRHWHCSEVLVWSTWSSTDQKK